MCDVREWCFAIALENGGLDNERALVGQQGGKRRFGGAGEGVVGAGVGDAAGGDITGIGRDGCSHVGHNRAFPILAFTGKTTCAYVKVSSPLSPATVWPDAA